jgi:hypothetical protein
LVEGVSSATNLPLLINIDEAKQERERILIDWTIENTKRKAARKAASKTEAKEAKTDDMASKSVSGSQDNVEKKAMDDSPVAPPTLLPTLQR